MRAHNRHIIVLITRFRRRPRGPVDEIRALSSPFCRTRYFCSPSPLPVVARSSNMDSRASSLSPVIDPDDTRSSPGSPASPAPIIFERSAEHAHNNNNNYNDDDDNEDDDDDRQIASSCTTTKSNPLPSDRRRVLIAGITAAAAAVAVAGIIIIPFISLPTIIRNIPVSNTRQYRFRSLVPKSIRKYVSFLPTCGIREIIVITEVWGIIYFPLLIPTTVRGARITIFNNPPDLKSETDHRGISYIVITTVSQKINK